MVKLSLNKLWIPIVGAQLHSYLPSVLDGRNWSFSGTGSVTHAKEPWYRWTRRVVGSTAGLDGLGKEKISSLRRDSNPAPPKHKLIVIPLNNQDLHLQFSPFSCHCVLNYSMFFPRQKKPNITSQQDVWLQETAISTHNQAVWTCLPQKDVRSD